jgi:hypothetical protein
MSQQNPLHTLTQDELDQLDSWFHPYPIPGDNEDRLTIVNDTAKAFASAVLQTVPEKEQYGIVALIRTAKADANSSIFNS